MSEEESPKEIEFLDKELIKGIWVMGLRVGYLEKNRPPILVDFLVTDGDKGYVASRVILSASIAKVLIKSLKGALEKIEKEEKES